MKEKYEGKIVEIFAPLGGRSLGYLKVIEVLNENNLYGLIPNTNIYTAYTLSDGIRVKIVEEGKS